MSKESCYIGMSTNAVVSHRLSQEAIKRVEYRPTMAPDVGTGRAKIQYRASNFLPKTWIDFFWEKVFWRLDFTLSSINSKSIGSQQYWVSNTREERLAGLQFFWQYSAIWSLGERVLKYVFEKPKRETCFGRFQHAAFVVECTFSPRERFCCATST